MAAVSSPQLLPQVIALPADKVVLNDLKTTEPEISHLENASPSYRVVENFRPMKVIVIGAGFSGIYSGIRIPERLRNVDFTIYEKNAGVGGTWFENRYPGCACDVPGTSAAL